VDYEVHPHPGRGTEPGGPPVSAWTVANLLRELGFALLGNAKQGEGTAHVDRDAQFAYLNAQSTAHIDASQPVIS
jgi:Rhodopirellula transposase DDE domain